jgi:hypothetical protein
MISEDWWLTSSSCKLLRENADVYIQIHGQQGYNEIIASLLSRMARMGEEDPRDEISTPVSVGYSQIAEDDTNSSL